MIYQNYLIKNEEKEMREMSLKNKENDEDLNVLN